MLASVIGSLFLALAWLMPFIAHAPQAAFNLFTHDMRTADILFDGDIMLDRSIRTAMLEHGDDHVFSCIADTLNAADLVAANLEGPITPHPSKSMGSVIDTPENYTFTFAPETPELLLRHNIQAVSLGNNHIGNFGTDGIRSTVEYLEAAGVGYFGDPLSDSVLSREVNGIRLAFIAYNQFGGDADTAIAQVEAARERGELPIIFAHWGDEYVPANDFQKELAHRFIDSGAEIVIGAHPHVVQEHEIYAGKHIYYSLGNFVFDQYWEDAVRTGLIVNVTFTPFGVAQVTESETFLERDRRTCLKSM